MRVRWLRVLVVSAALALAAPFCGIEVVYRWGLARVGELPRLASEPHVGRVPRALWAAEEGGAMEVEPLWPWTIVHDVVQATSTPRRRLPARGGALAGSVARLWLGARHLSSLERHWQTWSVSIWLSRNATAEQLAVEASQLVYFGHDAVGATEAARAWCGTEPEQLSWAQAAFLGGLVQSPSRYARAPEEAARRRRWVLDRLLAAGAITAAEHEAALAEPLPSLSALTPP